MLEYCQSETILKCLAVCFLNGVCLNVIQKFPEWGNKKKIKFLLDIIYKKLQNLQSKKRQMICNLYSTIGVHSIKELLLKNIKVNSATNTDNNIVKIEKTSFFDMFKPSTMRVLTHSLVCLVSVGGTLFLVKQNKGGDFVIWFLWNSFGKFKKWK